MALSPAEPSPKQAAKPLLAVLNGERCDPPPMRRGDFGRGDVYTWVALDPETKLVVRLRGNNQEQAEKMLSESGLKLIPDLQSAVKEAVEKSKTPVGAKR